MAHLLRGKQAGIQNDLSAGIGPDLFVLDEIYRIGLPSQISQIAYDPVQSLLAVGTACSEYGDGAIHVFGQQRVQVALPLPRKASVKTLQFCADKLVCLDSKNDLSIFSLEHKKLVAAYSAPGRVTAVHTDPALDYCLLGMQNGDVLAYDMDRERLAPLRIPNFWREQYPRALGASVVCLAFHPRDIGTLLIGYTEGAVIYSFKQNKPTRFFRYELPRGAPGGDSDPSFVNMARSPKLTQALWHPTGTFVLTGHEDGSLVFWDPKDGRIVMARTLQDTNVDKPGGGSTTPGATPGTFAVKEPLFKISWCANVDPDDTAILIAGGAASNIPTKGLTLFELGRTPVYATSSWEVLSAHFENPRRQRILPTPPNATVVDFCLIPRSSPHYAGAQDPIAVIALLSSGELITLSFPSGIPISPTNQLHPSLTLVHPFVTTTAIATVDRVKWLGMTERRAMGPPILTGGAEAPHPLKRFEQRNIIQTAHADGTVRLWDAGHNDEIENPALLQVDVARAVGRHEGVDITRMSLAGATGEFAVGTRQGELVVFRWGHNHTAGREPPPPGPNKQRELTDVKERTDPALQDGLVPYTLLDQANGPVSAIKLSDVGFVAAGFEGGELVVIDLRRPEIIFSQNVGALIGSSKRGSFIHRRRSTEAGGAGKGEYVTCLQFSVMTVEGDDYSSILLHAGTSGGHFATFKLLPKSGGSGGHEVVPAGGTTSIDDTRVLAICPLHVSTGQPAHASPTAVAGLRDGIQIPGVLCAVTPTGARLFRPGAAGKGAHKAFDDVFCDAAAIIQCADRGHALLGLFGDGSARAYGLPSLKELGRVPDAGTVLDPRRLADATVTRTGEILGWRGPAELRGIRVVGGAGRRLELQDDVLWNPDLPTPPRPTISNLQWLSGTQHVAPADMDVLIGGPDRPPSARMLAQLRADERAARDAERRERGAGGAAGGGSALASGSGGEGEGEGYWASMQRQLAERTEKLGLMGDRMDGLGENAAAWTEDVGRFVQRQKRNLVFGAVRGKLGL